MNNILKEIIDEHTSVHGKRAGYPVFHSSRPPYRKSISDEDLQSITKMAHTRWPEYTFKISSNQSMVRVGVYHAEDMIDDFKFTVKDFVNIENVTDASGVFEDNVDEFIEIVKKVLI